MGRYGQKQVLIALGIPLFFFCGHVEFEMYYQESLLIVPGSS